MSSETDPKVVEVMRMLESAKRLEGSDYNRVYGLIRDGLRWRATADAPSEGRTALDKVARFAAFEAGRTRYNFAPDGSYWQGYDAAMKAVEEFCRGFRGAAPPKDHEGKE